MPPQQDQTSRQQQLQESNPFNEQEDRTTTPKPVEFDQLMQGLMESDDQYDRMPEEFQPTPTDVGSTPEVLDRLMNQTTQASDTVMFLLRAKDERGHALDLVQAAANGRFSVDKLRTIINPPPEFLDEIGMTEKEWQAALNREIQHVCRPDGMNIPLPPNGDLRDNMLAMLPDNPTPGSPFDQYKNLFERSAGADQSYDPKDSARELLRVSYDDSLSPDEREAAINAALSRLTDPMRRNEVRRELNQMRNDIECATYDIDRALSTNPPDAADIQAILRGKSAEEIEMISLRFGQHTGYTGDPQSGALNDALTLLDNSTNTDARTAILAKFNAETQQGFKDAKLDAGGLAAENTISTAERELLMKGFDAAELARAIKEQIAEIRSEHGIGDNILDFFTGDWSEDGTTYQGLQRLMLGLSKDQVDQVADAYGKGSLGDTIGPHAQNIDGYVAEDGKYADQRSDGTIDQTEMETRATDVLAALTEHEADGYDDLSDADKEAKLEATRRLVRDAFSGLSEQEAQQLQNLIQGKRIESLTETVEVKDDKGEPVLDDDGKPKTEEVVNADGKPTSFDAMLGIRLGADPGDGRLLDRATEDIVQGFSASRTANRILESFRHPPVTSVDDRNARMKEVMRGLTPDQVAEVNKEYQRMLEQKMSLRDDIRENVYSNFRQGFNEILNNGSPERPGVETLPDTWEMTDPIEIVNQLDRTMNARGVSNDDRAANTLAMIQGLSDRELATLGPVAGSFQRAALTQLLTEANSPLEQIDREITREALKLGFNPWTRAEKLREAVDLIGTDNAQALTQIRDQLQKAQEGVDADTGAARIELIRRVYRQQTGHELEDDLTKVEDDLTDAEDDLLERTRPDAETVPAPEPPVEPRTAPGVVRVQAVDTAPAEVKAFIAQYADAAAIAEAETGVPAEVLLAEAGRISNWGQRALVADDNPFHMLAPRGTPSDQTNVGHAHESETQLIALRKYDDLADAFVDYAESLRQHGPAAERDKDYTGRPDAFINTFVEPKFDETLERHSRQSADEKLDTLEDNMDLLTR